MKEKEVNKDYERQKQILYVEKDDGTYGPVQTGSYLTNNYLDDFWLKKSNLEKQLAISICENEISPVNYFMVLNELSESELAARSGICLRRVRKHLKAAGFQKIRVSDLEKYAHVFGIPVANLFQVILYEDSDDIKSFFIKDKSPELFDITQVKTDNPFFVKTQIKRKQQ
jgi:hypothetical protein